MAQANDPCSAKRRNDGRQLIDMLSQSSREALEALKPFSDCSLGSGIDHDSEDLLPCSRAALAQCSRVLRCLRGHWRLPSCPELPGAVETFFSSECRA